MFMTLGERLRERRKKLRLTNGQVAKYIGISRAHVSDLENGKSNPSLELLRKLATYYKTSTDWLLEQTDDPRPLGAATDIETVYNLDDSIGIISELSEEVRIILTRLALSLKDYQMDSRERMLGEFILNMMGDIEERYGEEATNELDNALNLFARTGDDSGLKAWFVRYFNPGGDLPDSK